MSSRCLDGCKKFIIVGIMHRIGFTNNVTTCYFIEKKQSAIRGTPPTCGPEQKH